MTSLQLELAQCLQYFGPMTAHQILEKMNLQPRLEQLTLAIIQTELDRMAPKPDERFQIHSVLRVNQGVYACNRAIGNL
jgi:hypothetical protein